MKVEIYRGLPGAGKTTNYERTVKKSPEGFRSRKFSADDYHYTPEGKYEFKRENLSKAHGRCFYDCMVYFEHPGDLDLLVVDNTNVHAWEVAPYALACQAYGHAFEVVTFIAPWEECTRRNVHGVPAEKVFAMHQALLSERLPAHWPQRIVVS